MIWEILEIAALLVLINFVASNLSAGGAVHELLNSPVKDEKQIDKLFEKATSGNLLKLDTAGFDLQNNLFK